MNTLVFIDTETTGLDPRENQILTIGVVVDQAGRIVQEREYKIKYEGGAVVQKALEVNGIDLEEHDKTAMEASHALSELIRDLRDIRLKRYVAHNAVFDKQMLEMAFLKAGMVEDQYLVRSNWLCTKDLAGWLTLHGVFTTHMGKVSLDACLKALGMDDRGDSQHGALEDARLTRDAYYRMRTVAGWNPS